MPSSNNTHAITAGRAAGKGENFNSPMIDESFTVVLLMMMMTMARRWTNFCRALIAQVAFQFEFESSGAT